MKHNCKAGNWSLVLFSEHTTMPFLCSLWSHHPILEQSLDSVLFCLIVIAISFITQRRNLEKDPQCRFKCNFKSANFPCRWFALSSQKQNLRAKNCFYFLCLCVFLFVNRQTILNTFNRWKHCQHNELLPIATRMRNVCYWKQKIQNVNIGKGNPNLNRTL